MHCDDDSNQYSMATDSNDLDDQDYDVYVPKGQLAAGKGHFIKLEVLAE